MFLTLVYAEIERRWNKTPPFEIEKPNAKKKHGGKKYQARCLEILQWLHAEGDITKPGNIVGVVKDELRRASHEQETKAARRTKTRRLHGGG